MSIRSVALCLGIGVTSPGILLAQSSPNFTPGFFQQPAVSSNVGGISYFYDSQGVLRYYQTAPSPVSVQPQAPSVLMPEGQQRLGVVTDQGSYYYFYDNQGTLRYYQNPSSPSLQPAQSPSMVLPDGYQRVTVTDDQGTYYRAYTNQGQMGTGNSYPQDWTQPALNQWNNDLAQTQVRYQQAQTPQATTMPYRPDYSNPRPAPRRSGNSMMSQMRQFQNFVAGVNQYNRQFPGFGGGYRSYGGSGSSGGYSGGGSNSSGTNDPKQLVFDDSVPK